MTAELSLNIRLAFMLLGFIMASVWHLSRFCVMGALADYLYHKDTRRLKQIVAFMLISSFLIVFLLNPSLEYPHIYRQDIYVFQNNMNMHPIRLLLGGTLMGLGMFLASGCPTQQILSLSLGRVRGLLSVMILAAAAHFSMTETANQLFSYLEFTFLAIPAKLAIPLFFKQSHYLLSGIFMIILSLILIYTAYHNYKINKKWVMKWVGNILSFSPAIFLSFAVFGFWWLQASQYQPILDDTLMSGYANLGLGADQSLYSSSMLAPLANLLNALLFGHFQISAYVYLLFGFLISGFIWKLIYFGLNKLSIFAIMQQLKNLQKFQSHLKNQGFAPENHAKIKLNSQDLWQTAFGSICMGIGGVMSLGCTMGQLGLLPQFYGGILFIVTGYVLGAKLAIILLNH